MKKQKDPAMLWYPKDWLEGTAEMKPEEKGIYADLLNYQHQKWSLPNDLSSLARMCRVSEEYFVGIWNTIKVKFKTDEDGRFYNERTRHEMMVRAGKAHKNKIIGHYAKLIRESNLKKTTIDKVKKEFNIEQFVNFETLEATDRITDWFNRTVDQLENRSANANANANANIINNNSKELKEEKELNSLQIYIKNNLPTVSQLPKQLTYEEAERIIREFPKTVVEKVLLSMENYKPLLKNYQSVNLTLRNWIKREIPDTPADSAPKIIVNRTKTEIKD